MRDCEDWSWGKAGTILIERIILRKEYVLDDKNTHVVATSPFSIIHE
jgi:hypothetical protein